MKPSASLVSSSAGRGPVDTNDAATPPEEDEEDSCNSKPNRTSWSHWKFPIPFTDRCLQSMQAASPHIQAWSSHGSLQHRRVHHTQRERLSLRIEHRSHMSPSMSCGPQARTDPYVGGSPSTFPRRPSVLLCASNCLASPRQASSWSGQSLPVMVTTPTIAELGSTVDPSCRKSSGRLNRLVGGPSR